MRQLRLVIEVFRRQKREQEMVELLRNPPTSIYNIMQANHAECEYLIIDMMKDAALWESLQEYCWNNINMDMKTYAYRQHNILAPITDWQLWSGFNQAVDRMWNDEDFDNKG